MGKYRKLFLEESAEHLAEIGNALLELEKDVASVESIDVIFRMAHSIKSMAASLGYDSVTEVSHALEDHMEGIRAAGRLGGPEELALLFRGLENLEQMVAIVSETGEAPPPRPELIAELSRSTAEPASIPLREASSEGPAPEIATASRTSEEIDPDLAAVMAALESDGDSKKKVWR